MPPEFGLGGLHHHERLLPVALQAALDEPMLWLDLAIATLSALCLIAGALDLQPPLLKRLIVVGLKRLSRDQRRLHSGWSNGAQKPARDRFIDLGAADAQTPATRPSATTLPGQW